MSLAFGGLLPFYLHIHGVFGASWRPSYLPTRTVTNPRRQKGTLEEETGQKPCPEKKKERKSKYEDRRETKEEERKEKEEKAQHRAFPRGPPPQYYPGSNLLNFAVRMGSGEPG